MTLKVLLLLLNTTFFHKNMTCAMRNGHQMSYNYTNKYIASDFIHFDKQLQKTLKQIKTTDTTYTKHDIDSLYINIIKNLNENDTLKLTYFSQGCFHERNDTLWIYFGTSRHIRYKNTDRVLTMYDIETLEWFILQLINFQSSGGCTTNDDYVMTLNNIELTSISDDSCNFHGWTHLKDRLHLR